MMASGKSISDAFLPIEVKEYSESDNYEVLNLLQWGMTLDRVKGILDRGVLQYTESGGYMEDVTLGVESGRYFLYFDDGLRLKRILMQSGGSRNQMFSLDMTMEEVKGLLNCELIEKENIE